MIACANVVCCQSGPSDTVGEHAGQNMGLALREDTNRQGCRLLLLLLDLAMQALSV